jgi:hypothetical protein
MEQSFSYLPIGEVKLNPENPRTINKNQFEALKKSIQGSKKMLELSPVVINEDNMILGGNMRYKAMLDLGFTEVPCLKVIGLSVEKQKELIIKDNLNYGDWDWNVLLDWDKEMLKEIGLHTPRFFVDDNNERQQDNNTLAADFETWLNTNKIDLKLYFDPETYNDVIRYFNDQEETDKSKVILSLINKYFEENNLIKDRR